VRSTAFPELVATQVKGDQAAEDRPRLQHQRQVCEEADDDSDREADHGADEDEGPRLDLLSLVGDPAHIGSIDDQAEALA
jgi:hypothetical protein